MIYTALLNNMVKSYLFHISVGPQQMSNRDQEFQKPFQDYLQPCGVPNAAAPAVGVAAAVAAAKETLKII